MKHWFFIPYYELILREETENLVEMEYNGKAFLCQKFEIYMQCTGDLYSRFGNPILRNWVGWHERALDRSQGELWRRRVSWSGHKLEETDKNLKTTIRSRSRKKRIFKGRVVSRFTETHQLGKWWPRWNWINSCSCNRCRQVLWQWFKYFSLAS